MRTKRIVKNFTMIGLTIILVIISVGLFVGNIAPNKELLNKKQLAATSWNSSLSEIVTIEDDDTVVYLDIDELYTISGNTMTPRNPVGIVNAQTVIKINNGLDLYYFGELCNSEYKNSYLTYHYVLGQNIDYTEASRTFKLIKPIGWGSAPFSGIFDGQGFIISDLFFYKIDDATDYANHFLEDEENYLEYFALFSKNTGIIRNVGFVDANNIQTVDIFGEYFFSSTSTVVGENRGTIDHVFVQDLRGDNAGITCEGSYTITAPLAGFNYKVVPTDNPVISNCYVAVNYITSTSVILSDASHRYPFIISNTSEVGSGTLTNVYYDEEIIYHTDYMRYDGITPLQTTDFQNLTNFNVDNNWYTNATYTSETGSTNYNSYLHLVYPNLLGFDVRIHNNKNYFVINSAPKLIYFSNVLQYSPFRIANYLITDTCDMAMVSDGAFLLSNNIFQGTLDGSVQDNVDALSVVFADGNTSTNSAIINLNIYEGISYNGYHNYGLFGALGGTIQNLNIYNVNIIPQDLVGYGANSFSEITNFGILCGDLIGGTIDNVNVEGTININSGSTDNYMGTVYAGGIAGYSERGIIRNSTASGKIIGSLQSVTTNLTPSAIGGILGYNNNCNEISNCLSAVEIEAIRYRTTTNIHQYVGGVIGYALSNSSYELQNNGNIYVGVTLANKSYNEANAYYYGRIYMGGVIGLLQNATGTNGLYLNNADLYYYVNDNNYRTYISGVMNVISTVAMPYDVTSSETTPAAIQAAVDAVNVFSFSSVSSSGTLYIENQLSASKQTAKLELAPDSTITNGIDIRAAGLVYSYLTQLDFTGLYTLNFKYSANYRCTQAGGVYTVGTILDKAQYLALSIEERAKFVFVEDTKPTNGAQEIDVSMLDEYAPCVNSDNKVTKINSTMYVETNQLLASSQTFHFDTPTIETHIDVKRGYNYRNISYITNKTVLFYTLQLSGNLNGRNFSVDNLRNDGDINLLFSVASASTLINAYQNYYGDDKKIKLFGCLEEINLDCRATNVYNGGDITISSTATTQNDLMVVFSLYVAGICYKNVGNDDSVTDEGLMLSSGYVGSLHNSINNGDIRVTNEAGKSGYFYGQSRIGGITCFNCSTISSSYNLGDISNINYVYAPSATYGSYGGEFEVETGGFCFIMQNDPLNENGTLYTRANIIDSANNGTIISATTSTGGWINAGGFVVRNERCESGPTIENDTTLNVNPNEQRIEYCINYGDIYAYNPRTNQNDALTGDEPDCKAAGFVCLGVCTIVDVINYGKIMSNKVAGGMYGYVFFSRMIAGSTIETANGTKVYIANAINYGAIARFEFGDEVVNNLIAGTTDNITALPYNRTYPTGALIGMARSAGYNNATYRTSVVFNCLNIKNLVNFYDDANMVGRTAFFHGMNDTNSYTNFETNMNAGDYTAVTNAFRYMATTKNIDSSPYPFGNCDESTWQANGTTYGIKAYYKSTEVGDTTVADTYSKAYNGGIFNTNYTLRSAPALLDVNGNVVTDQTLADPNNTDNFIADYIQFVPYSKVNEYLIDKINLSANIYENAVSALLENAEALDKVVVAYLNDSNDTQINTIYNAVLSHSSFNSAKTSLHADYNALVSLLSELMANHPNDDAIYNVLINIINASGATPTSLFGSSDALYEVIVQALRNVPAANPIYATLFNTLINNPTYLANYIATQPAEEVSTNVAAYLNALSATDRDTLFTTLCENTYIVEALASATYDHNSLFNTLLANVDSAVITSLYNAASGVATPDANFLASAAAGLSNANLTTVLNYLLTNITTITNTTVNNDKNNFGLSSNGKTEVLSNRYNTTANITNIYTAATTTDATRAALYNNLKTNHPDVFNILMSGIEAEGYVYIPADAVTINTQYASEVEGQGQLIDSTRGSVVNDNYNSTGAEVYTGKYTNTSGATIAKKTLATFTWCNKSALDRYRWNSNRMQPVTSTWYTPNFQKDVSSSVISYVYYTLNGTYYQSPTYGTYVRVPNTQGTPYSDLTVLSAISDSSKATIMTRMMTNYNTLSATDRAITDAVLADYYYSSATLTKAHFSSSVADLSAADKLSMVLYLIRTYPAAATYFTGVLDTYLDERSIITATAASNSTYYVTVMNQIASGLTATEKMAYITAITGNSDSAAAICYKEQLSTIADTDTEKKEVIMRAASNDLDYFEDMLSTFKANGLLENSDVLLYFNALIAPTGNRTYLDTLINSLTLTREDKIALIGAYASHDATLLRYVMNTYYGVNLDSNDYENLLNAVATKANLDQSQFTDYVGIYALASSYGIQNGMFIPDNINLINLDPYEIDGANEYNDPTWRGGTLEDPNAYLMTDTDKVNYKVFYMMKQLKKSISTVVFKIELVDDVTNPDLVVTNDIDTDYDIENSVIDFYIPSNADELKQDYLYINTSDGSYELAFRASFNTTPAIVINGTTETYSVGDIITQDFVVQAEDTTVTQEYTVRIHVTAPKSVDSLNSIVINGATQLVVGTNYSIIDRNALLTYAGASAPYVHAEAGKIAVSYNTYNIPGGTDMAGALKLYSYSNNNTYPTNFTNILDYCTPVSNELWHLDDATSNNGIVNMEEDARYYIGTGEYNGSWVIMNGNVVARQAIGELTYDVAFNDQLPGGIYMLEFIVNAETKYYTIFQKESSSAADVLFISYNSSSFDNVDRLNSNVNSPSTVEYGQTITASLLQEFDDYAIVSADSKYQITTTLGTMLDITISPRAQGYTVGNVSWTRTDGYITYAVPITVTAENGTTKLFTYYLKEATLTGDLTSTYEDGRTIFDSNTTTPNVFDYSFAKYSSPSYSVYYDMNNFYFEGDSQYLSIELTNAEAILNTLNEDYMEEIDRVAFDGMTLQAIDALSDAEKLTRRIAALKTLAFVTTVTEGDHVMIDFMATAPSATYQFAVTYQNSNEFTAGDNISWTYDFDAIYITKDKNLDSYLEAISFVSDTVVTALDTIASPTTVAVFTDPATPVAGYVDYNTLVANLNGERRIISLPSKIFYNEYDQDINKQDEIYIIGLVDRTAISEYSPTFTLPEDSYIYLTTTINNVVYRRVMYEYTNNTSGTPVTEAEVFLVNEAGTSIVTNDGTVIATGVDVSTFTYNGIVYTVSDYAGTSNTANIGLLFDFSNMKEVSGVAGINEEFNYANYRVYSEAFDPNNVNVLHYTDFKISVQDITNNVIINVFIELDDTMSAADQANFTNTVYNRYLFLLLSNFQATEENPTVYDQFNNMMGAFVYYDSATRVFTITKYRTNTSGRYEIDFDLPDGFTFSFEAFKKGAYVDNGVAGEDLDILNSITSQVIDLYIKIEKSAAVTIDWGQHFESKLTEYVPA